MPTGNNPNHFDLSLIQQREQRQAIVQKMRGKLAGPSQAGIQAMERKRKAAHKSAFDWGWRLALAALFIGGNAYYFSGKSPISRSASRTASLTLPEPSPKLDVNNKALYWAFALYDFDRLKASYGVPKNAIIDAGMAAENLRVLLPKVDSRTRFIIDGYMVNDRRKT